jgi:hypothetical protein
MNFKLPSVLASTLLASLTATTGWADVQATTHDFESLVQVDPAALTNDGWLVFANVFAVGGVYLYGYGPFVAPNGGPAFCGITSGQGGPTQGAQQLVVYSDYNNADHQVGNLIESNVFLEQTVDASDVGNTFRFTFDAKMGDLASPSTASAFIKVIDNVNFTLSGFQSIDMTTIPTTWGTYSLEITLDSSHVNHFFQIGFSNEAANYVSSGVIYDNVSLEELLPPPGTLYCFGDGVGASCPCGNNNDGSNGLAGCANGVNAGGAALSATGGPSVSNDTVALTCTGLQPNQPGLFFRANNAVNSGNGNPFGDGLRCAGGNLVRLGTIIANSSGVAVSNSGAGAGLIAGDVRRYQYWYRNPASSPCGTNFNLSNGLELTWGL